MREFKRNAKVLLIDDNANHLRGVKELIEIEGTFDVIATTTSANVGITMVKKYRPDVILMDINMPEKDGLQAIQEIDKLGLGVKIISLSGYDDSDLIFRAMKLGAKGYILKTMASTQLIRAIEDVLAGKIFLPATLSARFFEYFQKSHKMETSQSYSENLLSNLTNREEEVLELLTEGENYKSVAQKLFISETTVKTHVNSIFQKLQVNDRTQAVLYALKNGFGNKKRVKISA